MAGPKLAKEGGPLQPEGRSPPRRPPNGGALRELAAVAPGLELYSDVGNEDGMDGWHLGKAPASVLSSFHRCFRRVH